MKTVDTRMKVGEGSAVDVDDIKYLFEALRDELGGKE